MQGPGRILAFFTALAGLLTVSCRSLVLEDRTPCPSFLFFHVEDTGGLPMDEEVVVEVRETMGMNILASDKVSFEKMDRRSYFMEVLKSREILATGLSGVKNARRDGTRWTVREGMEWDRIYRFSEKAPASGEETHIPEWMKKEHSVVTVRFNSADGGFPYYVVARSGTCGLDMVSGKPVPGEFSFRPDEGTEGEFSFTVPRQADLSLSLELWAKPGNPALLEEGLVDRIVLWDALSKIPGFSWELENLMDISVDIDYVRSQVTVTVNDWMLGATIDYRI